MDSRSILDELFPEVIKASENIYNFAELGSSEHRSSRYLADLLKKHGFSVKENFAGMSTAFRAEIGTGRKTLGFLAEYDALPNGHSCGHNLISGWAVGCALVLSKIVSGVKICVVGTPSEEGIGEYAGSKIRMVDGGYLSDVDVFFGSHPSDSWGVGSTALSDLTLRLEIHGKSAHGADSPEEGSNALDAAVSIYQGINNLRGWAKNDKHLVVGMIITKGGEATNVIPELAELNVEIRSTSQKFVTLFAEKVTRLATSMAQSYGCTVKDEVITPFYSSYRNSRILVDFMKRELELMGINPKMHLEDAEIPSGSTDEANVSQKIPTCHIDFPVGYPGIPGHSDEFREASNPVKASESLYRAILATVNCALKISNPEILEKIKADFESGK
ncbi:MAG TPA: M20 family metallopeptidase [Thermoplasmataceae archaeon]|nr:M20 family metallopeptidase [Thermoplasmatales archaeon AK]HLH85958.1 M20 family metallopeptidase [Thermoplasmataceae archaeon]